MVTYLFIFKAELRRHERECSIAQKEINDLQKQVSSFTANFLHSLYYVCIGDYFCCDKHLFIVSPYERWLYFKIVIITKYLLMTLMCNC